MYLLDTSAILAFVLQERGGERVGSLLEEERVYIAAPSWLELRVRLEREEAGAELLQLLESGILTSVDITAEVARRGFGLKSAATERVPVVDALIAGAAAVHEYTLVHRDDHFLGIPAGMLTQEMLG